MANDPMVHEGSDGRGPRDVLLNGKLMSDVMYADVRRGVIRILCRPIRVDRGSVVTQELHGHVEVYPKGQCPPDPRAVAILSVNTEGILNPRMGFKPWS